MVEASEVILGVTEAKMGGRVLISFQKNDPACIHSLTVCLNSQEVETIENLGGSFIWQVPDYTPFCPDFKSLDCELRAKTWLHGQYLGLRIARLILLVPDPVKLYGVNLVLGQTALLDHSPRAKNYRLDLDLILNGYTFPIATGFQGESLSWVPPYELARQIPTLQKTGAQLLCTTRHGSAVIGEIRTEVTLEVPENQETRPRIRQVRLVPRPNGLKPPFDRLYIRGKSGLTAAYYVEDPCSPLAWVSLRAGPREVTTDDFTGSLLELPVLDIAGSLEVTLTARDSRGFSSSWTELLQVQPYQKPRVVPLSGSEDVLCERAGEQGQLMPGGLCLAIRAGRRYTELSEGGENLNTCVLRYRYKKAEAQSFGPWEILLSGEDPRKEVSALLTGVVTDPDSSYRVELSALDSLGEEHRLGFSVMTRAISFVLYDGVDGAAFGKYPEQPHVVDLAPHMTLKVRGELQVLGERWRELGLSSHVNPSACPRGRHEDTGCFYRISQGNRVIVTCNCALTLGNEPVPIGLRQLPAEIRPQRPVSAVCPREGGLALLTAEPDGVIDARSLSGPDWSGWLDGYLEYYL